MTGRRVAVKIPIQAGGRAGMPGVLRLRRTGRFAACPVPLRMTGAMFAVAIFFLAVQAAGATTYYVSSSSGNDGNSGTSSAAAWQTVTKVNGHTFSPGDSILFRRGDVWNESLVPASSGAAGNPITFDAFGTGAPPNLTGYYAVPSTAWVHVTGNAWKASLPGGYPL